MNKIFAEKLGKTMKVYIDDMLVKSNAQKLHVHHLSEAFEVLKKYNMKLNPAKCHFGVKAENFLGYLITKRGIEANPNQFKSVLSITEPRMKKEVQRLTGQLATLARFILKALERFQPFFKPINNRRIFKWADECKRALERITEFLNSPPLLAKLNKGKIYTYTFHSQW